jgi:hypothetical protein
MKIIEKGHRKGEKRQQQKIKPYTISTYDNESNSIEDGMSQFSNNDAFLILGVNLDDPLYKFHKEILELKFKIIRTMAFSFYKPEEYALINYICHITEEKFKNVFWAILSIEKEHQSRIEKNVDQHLVVKKQDII